MASTVLGKRGSPEGAYDTLDVRPFQLAKYHHQNYESLVKRSNLVFYIQNQKNLESPHDLFFSGIRYGREQLQEQVAESMWADLQREQELRCQLTAAEEQRGQLLQSREQDLASWREETEQLHSQLGSAKDVISRKEQDLRILGETSQDQQRRLTATEVEMQQLQFVNQQLTNDVDKRVEEKRSQWAQEVRSEYVRREEAISEFENKKSEWDSKLSQISQELSEEKSNHERAQEELSQIRRTMSSEDSVHEQIEQAVQETEARVEAELREEAGKAVRNINRECTKKTMELSHEKNVLEGQVERMHTEASKWFEEKQQMEAYIAQLQSQMQSGSSSSLPAQQYPSPSNSQQSSPPGPGTVPENAQTPTNKPSRQIKAKNHMNPPKESRKPTNRSTTGGGIHKSKNPKAEQAAKQKQLGDKLKEGKIVRERYDHIGSDIDPEVRTEFKQFQESTAAAIEAAKAGRMRDAFEAGKACEEERLDRMSLYKRQSYLAALQREIEEKENEAEAAHCMQAWLALEKGKFEGLQFGHQYWNDEGDMVYLVDRGDASPLKFDFFGGEKGHFDPKRDSRILPLTSYLGTFGNKIFAQQCVIAQLPECQAEAAAAFLGAKELEQFEHRLFKYTKRSRKCVERQELPKMWTQVVKLLRKNKKFRAAAEFWAEGEMSSSTTSCWPAQFVDPAKQEACTLFRGKEAREESKEGSYPIATSQDEAEINKLGLKTTIHEPGSGPMDLSGMLEAANQAMVVNRGKMQMPSDRGMPGSGRPLSTLDTSSTDADDEDL
ncbi:hypothetical protein LTR37_010499 [Vermiconidia calcicola]|uniref:Uncharacterized protein n=1 Tax=Vermiconidia calcicola TaxID=1690605 RepID=A0ACC3N5C6_9PEZI|nr:hypothetical protein LTR37_010499 [Vermiconidia calcicola]